MSESMNHHRQAEPIQVTEEYPSQSQTNESPSLWKQTVTILAFLVLLAALSVGMAYGMAWLVNLG